MARSHFARRRGGIALALSLGCLLLAVPGLASAAPGTPDAGVDPPVPPVKDTVTQTVESVLDPVRQTAKPVTDAVDGATSPVRKPVDEATGAVTDTVTKAVTEVVDPPTGVTDPDPTVKDPVVRDPDPATGTGVPPSHDVAGGRRQTDPSASPRRPSGQDAQATPDREAGGAGRLAVLLRQSRRDSPAATGTVPPAAPAPDVPARSVPEQVKQAAIDASRAFRFPLLLAAAVLLFLGIQARVDARDPKLSARAVDEELTFA